MSTPEEAPTLLQRERFMLELGVAILIFILVGLMLRRRDNKPLYFKDFGKGPFPTGRPRKERGH